MPPANGPEDGEMLLTPGMSRYRKLEDAVPPGAVTITGAAPGARIGVTNVSVESLTTENATLTPPTERPEAPVKPLPEIVTAVPPAAGPEPGTRPAICGAVR